MPGSHQAFLVSLVNLHLLHSDWMFNPGVLLYTELQILKTLPVAVVCVELWLQVQISEPQGEVFWQLGYSAPFTTLFYALEPVFSFLCDHILTLYRNYVSWIFHAVDGIISLCWVFKEYSCPRYVLSRRLVQRKHNAATANLRDPNVKQEGVNVDLNISESKHT